MASETKHERLEKLKKKMKQSKLKDKSNKLEEDDEEDDIRFMDQRVSAKFKSKDGSGLPRKKKSNEYDANQIDERFTHMFTDSNFRSVSKVDRYGEKVDPNSQTDLDKFYDKRNMKENPESKKPKKKKNAAMVKGDEEFHWSAESSEEDNEITNERELKDLLGEEHNSVDTEEEDELWEKTKNVPEFQGNSKKLA